MALKKTPLMTSVTQETPGNYFPRRVEGKAMLAGTAATHSILEPVTFNAAGKVIPWVDGAEIHGFIAQFDVVRDAVDDVMCNIMVAGDIDYNSVVLPAAGATQGALDTALKAAQMHQRDLIVENLAGKQ